MTWLILALTLGALAVVVWVSRERRGQRQRRDDLRRSVEERERDRSARMERRRRLGLPDDEERQP